MARSRRFGRNSLWNRHNTHRPPWHRYYSLLGRRRYLRSPSKRTMLGNRQTTRREKNRERESNERETEKEKITRRRKNVKGKRKERERDRGREQAAGGWVIRSGVSGVLRRGWPIVSSRDCWRFRTTFPVSARRITLPPPPSSYSSCLDSTRLSEFAWPWTNGQG